MMHVRDRRQRGSRRSMQPRIFAALLQRNESGPNGKTAPFLRLVFASLPFLFTLYLVLPCVFCYALWNWWDSDVGMMHFIQTLTGECLSYTSVQNITVSRCHVCLLHSLLPVESYMELEQADRHEHRWFRAPSKIFLFVLGHCDK
jgi:hypothetical protein